MNILYSPNEYSQQRQREKRRNIYPVLMAMQAQYRYKNGDNVNWRETPCNGYEEVDKIITEPENIPFLSLPSPNRVFTNANHPMYQDNGNFKFHPATYMLSANGCWHGKCSFCVERKARYEIRPVDIMIEELKQCKHLGFKEVFDDSGSFPVGDWLKEFCNKAEPIKMVLGCNMRFGVLHQTEYKMMRKAGFRMMLYGLESANQATLDKIHKNIDITKVEHELKTASKCGIEPHIAVMFGYPWETDNDAERTLKLVHRLLRKGYAKTAQASLYMPDDSLTNSEHKRYVSRIYEAGFWFDFWFNRIKDIKCKEDITYIFKGIKAALKGGT